MQDFIVDSGYLPKHGARATMVELRVTPSRCSLAKSYCEHHILPAQRRVPCADRRPDSLLAQSVQRCSSTVAVLMLRNINFSVSEQKSSCLRNLRKGASVREVRGCCLEERSLLHTSTCFAKGDCVELTLSNVPSCQAKAVSLCVHGFAANFTPTFFTFAYCVLLKCDVVIGWTHMEPVFVALRNSICMSTASVMFTVRDGFGVSGHNAHTILNS